MGFYFCSFASGSSGNSYLVKNEDTAILVDVGISGKKILAGLADTDTELEEVQGILITHEHIDHVKSLKMMSKKIPWAAKCANAGTWDEIYDRVPLEQQKCFETGSSFKIGSIEVKSFPISHDAREPVGYSLRSGGRCITIVTDTGCITEEIFEEIKEADLLVIEANHDEEMLKVGSYPWQLKQRILGKYGHLSNAATGKCLCRLFNEAKGMNKRRKVLLAHLSGENNFPEMAFQTIKNILEEEEHYIGSHIEIAIMDKDALSRVYEI